MHSIYFQLIRGGKKAEVKEEKKYIIDQNEEIISEAIDTAFVQRMALDSELAKAFGSNTAEVKRLAMYCDKDGNTYEMRRELTDLLYRADGELYLVSQFGDDKPIPVMIDYSKDTYSVLIGEEAIKNSTEAVVPQRPKEPGLVSKMYNAFYKLTHHDTPSQTMQEYDKAKLAYERAIKFNERRKMIIEGRLPEAVSDKVEHNKNGIAKVSKDNADRYERMVQNYEILAALPDSEYDNDMFDYSLAELLVDKAFTDPKGKMFGSIVFKTYKPYEEGFNERKLTSELSQNDGFKEFAWTLRNNYPHLVKDLKAHSQFVSKPPKALEEISALFCMKYANSDSLLAKGSGIKYNSYVAEKNRYMQFEKHLNELEDEKYVDVIKAAKQVLKSGSAESKKLLASLDDEQLASCGAYLKAKPDTNFEKLLKDGLKAPEVIGEVQNNRPRVGEPVEERLVGEPKQGQPELAK